MEAFSAVTVILNADPAVAALLAGTTEKWVAGDVCPPLPQPTRRLKPQIETSRIRVFFITPLRDRIAHSDIFDLTDAAKPAALRNDDSDRPPRLEIGPPSRSPTAWSHLT